METSVIIWFIFSVFTCSTAAVAFSQLFCQNALLISFRPSYFAVPLIIISLFVVGFMTESMVKMSNGAVQPENILAFGMIFFSSAVAGLFVMLPSILRALRFYDANQ